MEGSGGWSMEFAWWDIAWCQRHGVVLKQRMWSFFKISPLVQSDLTFFCVRQWPLQLFLNPSIRSRCLQRKSKRRRRNPSRRWRFRGVSLKTFLSLISYQTQRQDGQWVGCETIFYRHARWTQPHTNDHIRMYHGMQEGGDTPTSVSDACQCRQHNDLA